MVATQHEYVTRQCQLETAQQDERLHTPSASVYEIAIEHEHSLFAWCSCHLEHVTDIMVLAVGVTDNYDGSFRGRGHNLQAEEFP